jgi:hypothetical protein
MSSGYYYEVSEEQIRKWKAIPAEQKLQWLEEANVFLYTMLNDEKKKIVREFRSRTGIAADTSEPGFHPS